MILLLLHPGRGVEYCDQPVCLCVSVCLLVMHLVSTVTYSNVKPFSAVHDKTFDAGPIGTKFCMQIPCGRGSVLLRRCCSMLCTSAFMDDVTFGRNGCNAERRGDTGAESDVYECLLKFALENILPHYSQYVSVCVCVCLIREQNLGGGTRWSE